LVSSSGDAAHSSLDAILFGSPGVAAQLQRQPLLVLLYDSPSGGSEYETSSMACPSGHRSLTQSSLLFSEILV